MLLETERLLGGLQVIFKVPLPLIVLTIIFLSGSAYAKMLSASVEEKGLSDPDIDHWFSIDSTKPIHVEMEKVSGKTLENQSSFRFISDDGQGVNGMIAFPGESEGASKLALLMHPMGADQSFWWSEKNSLKANRLIDRLLEQGYVLISLDARMHGQRAIEGIGARELLKRARSEEPRMYLDTIAGTVRDYRQVLHWAKTEFQPEKTLVMGYSMGAQNGLLLSSYEPSVDTVIAMVPPYVSDSTSPVAPRNHIKNIVDAEVLWLAGTEDKYSNKNQTEKTFKEISSMQKTLVWFESGHRLPNISIDKILDHIDASESGSH